MRIGRYKNIYRYIVSLVIKWQIELLRIYIILTWKAMAKVAHQLEDAELVGELDMQMVRCK